MEMKAETDTRVPHYTVHVTPRGLNTTDNKQSRGMAVIIAALPLLKACVQE